MFAISFASSGNMSTLLKKLFKISDKNNNYETSSSIILGVRSFSIRSNINCSNTIGP